MKLRLFTIPNMLTLANLICGSLAICDLLSGGGYNYAFMLIILAAVFDFFDGFVARLLKQSSPLGGELDSLADVVSFGFAPAVVMMSLFADGERLVELDLLDRVGYYLPLIIVAFSALRLAKFNLDSEQSCEFIGLPTPACALLCVSLGVLHTKGFLIPAEYIIIISVVLALLLISPIRMFALKFAGFGWRGNVVRYSFLALSALLFVVLQLDAVAPIIILYIALSVVLHLVGYREGRKL